MMGDIRGSIHKKKQPQVRPKNGPVKKRAHFVPLKHECPLGLHSIKEFSELFPLTVVYFKNQLFFTATYINTTL